MTTIRIEAEFCKGCGLCVYYCPRDVLELSNEANAKGYEVVCVRQSEQCVGCKLCEVNCPDMAIQVESVPGGRAQVSLGVDGPASEGRG